MKKIKKNYLVTILIALLLIILLSITIWVTVYQSKTYIDKLIVDDMTKLNLIFNRINDKCGILGFEQQKNAVNFLNVEKFSGSQVGPMNLMYPEKWEGPYLVTNPTIQEKFYQVIKTKNGYYLAPGDDVKLSNGQIIGKDLVLNKNFDFEKSNNNSLINNNPIAIKIKTLANIIEDKKNE